MINFEILPDQRLKIFLDKPINKNSNDIVFQSSLITDGRGQGFESMLDPDLIGHVDTSVVFAENKSGNAARLWAYPKGQNDFFQTLARDSEIIVNGAGFPTGIIRLQK